MPLYVNLTTNEYFFYDSVADMNTHAADPAALSLANSVAPSSFHVLQPDGSWLLPPANQAAYDADVIAKTAAETQETYKNAITLEMLAMAVTGDVAAKNDLVSALAKAGLSTSTYTSTIPAPATLAAYKEKQISKILAESEAASRAGILLTVNVDAATAFTDTIPFNEKYVFDLYQEYRIMATAHKSNIDIMVASGAILTAVHKRNVSKLISLLSKEYFVEKVHKNTFIDQVTAVPDTGNLTTDAAAVEAIVYIPR